MLRDKLWEAYFAGAMGKTDCSAVMCSPLELGMMSDSEPMSENCRRCHYPLEDFINSDHEACLHGDLIRCVSLTRGINNYMQDIFRPNTAVGGGGQLANATTEDEEITAEDGSEVIAP